MKKNWSESGRAAALHLGISLVVALLAALVVFLAWYPAPFDQLSGGRKLFALLVSVDVVLGPLVTLVVFNRNKSRRHLIGDLMVIGTLQLMALSYGLWTVHQARPVYVAFEIDRLRVVQAVDVAKELLPIASEHFKKLPTMGPGLVAVRPFASANEKVEATMAALQGIELGFRPDFWIRYENSRGALLKVAKPLGELIVRKPDALAQLEKALAGSGIAVEKALYLPLHARDQFWTALISPVDAKPFAYVALDPY